LPSFKAFQGDWSGQLVLDTSSGTPVLNFNGEGRAVAMSKMLGTLANFSRLDGTGSFRVKANATGTSIDALMRDLDGDMSTNLTEGALKGFNVAQAVRSASSLREAVATGNLRNLDFGAVLSTAAETDFTKFESVLKIENGVAKVDLLKLLNPVLGIDGTGRIDIGGQTLDVRLATAIDKKGTGAGSVVQLNGIPVPVRISGSWSKLRVTPDFSGIEAQLRADAGARVRDEVTSRVGGAGGGVVSDVLGLPKKTAPAPVPSTAPADASSPVVTPSPAPAPAKPATTLKDAGKKAVRDALGGLINTKKPAPAPAPEPEPAPTPAPEPAIEVQPESPPIEGGD
jgi:AsmA protein